MTQQVLYLTSTGQIIDWQDTAAFAYPAPPAGTATLAVTSAQFAAKDTAGPQMVSGGALAPYVAPPVVPQTVNAFQARAAMHAAPSKLTGGTTILADVTALMAASSTNPVAVLAWEYQTTFGRADTWITTLAPSLGLASADLDALFVAAAAILP